MPFDHFSFIAPLYAGATYSNTGLLRQFADLPIKGRLLDLGGGTGRVSSAIAGLVEEVIVADVSMGMLRPAHLSGLRTVCCASESLPFADDSFERVLMVDALHHVIDHERSAGEMLRVLKGGGLVVIEEPDIRTFGAKLIAVIEKLLLMRSHFLAPENIQKLFPRGNSNIQTEDGTVWVIIKK